MSKEKHVKLPKDTPAFLCANCGAVALDAKNLCKVMGKGKKSDWCGTKSEKSPTLCHNKVHNNRWQCKKCGQVSVNPALLRTSKNVGSVKIALNSPAA